MFFDVKELFIFLSIWEITHRYYGTNVLENTVTKYLKKITLKWQWNR